MKATSTPPTVVSAFKGLNNVLDTTSASPDWQSVANNIDITDAGKIKLRDGYAKTIAASNIQASYSSFDYSKLFIVDSGALKRVNADGSTNTLYQSLVGPFYWAEINNSVYLSCASDKIEILPGGVARKWGVQAPTEPNISAASGYGRSGYYQACTTLVDEYGREGGASISVGVDVTTGGITLSGIPVYAGYKTRVYVTGADDTVFCYAATLDGETAYTYTGGETGRELTTQLFDEPPASGQHIAFYGTRGYMAEHIPEIDQTVIWKTQSHGYHLFNLEADYHIIPVEVTQMYGADVGLVIATQSRVYVYDLASGLHMVAEYGAVPGQHADLGADGLIYFWTKRGLCRAMPFENLTESRVSVAPGIHAGGGIIEKGGY